MLSRVTKVLCPLFLLLACGVRAQETAPTGTLYMLPQGAGLKDGSSFANALDHDLIACIVSANDAQKVLSTVEEGAKLNTTNSVLWLDGKAAENPRFLKDAPEWNGVGNNFDSQTYGTTHGYHSSHQISLQDRNPL